VLHRQETPVEEDRVSDPGISAVGEKSTWRCTRRRWRSRTDERSWKKNWRG